MKFTLTFKTPGVLDQITEDNTFSEEEAKDAMSFANQWLRYEELIDIEFDTKAKTAKVRKVK